MRAGLIAGLAGVCALTLAACGQPASQAPSETSSAQADSDGKVTFDTIEHLPDWLFILRTSDGGTIHYNQRLVTRVDGMADIWVQVQHGRAQAWEFETETTETVVRYTMERMHYRFDCAAERFAIVERQIMGANEHVVGTIEPELYWRNVPQPVEGRLAPGAAPHLFPIACLGR